MGINIKLNLDVCYTLTETSADLKLSKFKTIVKDGSEVELGIVISDTAHDFLPDVYNLAFGPVSENNQIDDKAIVSHQNISKALSTIAFAAFTFLAENPGKYIGIDGSNNVRAFLYYKCINNNHDYLSNYFDIFGVNYYVRILRKIQDEDSSYPIDVDDIAAIPKRFVKDEFIVRDKLYNYFIFKLNEE